jgi:hypothetical protein
VAHSALSRRELIAAFLGTAVAQQACRRAAPRPRPLEGAIVDRAVERGHRLRDAAALPMAKEAQRVEVLVVGAGVAGLSAAWRLAGAGVRDFLVCELDAQGGGNARSGVGPHGAYPWGAHYLPAPLGSQGPVPRLLRELGVVQGVNADGAPTYAEAALVHEPQERVFYRGHWYEGLYLRAGATAADLAELERFEAQMAGFAARVDGKGRKAFAVPTDSSSDDAEWTALDRVTFAAWLEGQRFTSARLRWLVDYACRDEFGATAAEVSAWAGIWYFAARQDGRGHRSEGFLTWPEGNGRLVAQLKKACGDRLRTSVMVHRIVPSPKGCEVDAVDGQGAPHRFLARQVIFAGPAFVRRHIVAEPGAGGEREGLPTASPRTTASPSPGPTAAASPDKVAAAATARPAATSSASASRAGLSYSPWVVANLAVERPPASRGFPLAWDNVLYESQSLGYVLSTHQRDVARVSEPAMLTWYYPLVGAEPARERARMLSASFEDWAALVTADLSFAHPDLSQVAKRLEICRWGHAMVRPTPGLIFGETLRQARRSVAGTLHFAHSDLSGISVFENANWHGVRAAEEVLAALGVHQPSWA